MAAPGITVVKTFTYRDAPEEWSNKYHFQGTAPSTPADWRALADAFITEEKAILSYFVSITKVLCYTDTDNPAVYTYTLADFGGNVAGTYMGVDEDVPPGDSAYLLRWNTGRVSTRGKPIYLFKYYHGGNRSSTDRDQLKADLKTLCSTFANSVRSSSGAWPGLADKTGAEPVGYLAETYYTTRTLKRRGRRPT